jgi:hypothetical protein
MNRILTSSLLLLLLAPTWGCNRATTSTAVIRRDDEPDKFRSCTVELGWTSAELYAACGEPSVIRSFAEDPEKKCLGYPSKTASGPGGYYVCMRPLVSSVYAVTSVHVPSSETLP